MAVPQLQSDKLLARERWLLRWVQRRLRLDGSAVTHAYEAQDTDVAFGHAGDGVGEVGAHRAPHGTVVFEGFGGCGVEFEGDFAVLAGVHGFQIRGEVEGQLACESRCELDYRRTGHGELLPNGPTTSIAEDGASTARFLPSVLGRS